MTKVKRLRPATQAMQSAPPPCLKCGQPASKRSWWLEFARNPGKVHRHCAAVWVNELTRLGYVPPFVQDMTLRDQAEILVVVFDLTLPAPVIPTNRAPDPGMQIELVSGGSYLPPRTPTPWPHLTVDPSSEEGLDLVRVGDPNGPPHFAQRGLAERMGWLGHLGYIGHEMPVPEGLRLHQHRWDPPAPLGLR
jgi:hypothetical protein